MNIEFIFPWRQLHWWIGVSVLAIAIVVLAMRALERRREGRLARFVDANLAPRLLPGYNARIRRPLFWLTVVGCASMAIVFAQPHWGQAWQRVGSQSHDIVICLDTSESMRAANPLPTRLDRAKQKILSLLERAPENRFGLIAFSGGASLQCPLTHDQGYLKAVLSSIDTDTISLEGTDIASALFEAAKLFKEEAESTGVYDKNSRAVLLISDGEAVAGDALKEAEKVAEYANVYVIGVGDPNGAEIMLPDWMGRYVKVKDGDKPHLSKLDEENLQKIALAGNGAYSRSTPDNSDIEWIYDVISQMTAYASSSDVRLRLVNRYQWPLALAILCFAGEGVWLAVMPRLRRLRERKLAADGADADWSTPVTGGTHHA